MSQITEKSSGSDKAMSKSKYRYDPETARANGEEDEFIEKLLAAKTQWEFSKIVNSIYSLSSESLASTYTPAIPMTWPRFYAIYDSEMKFGMSTHFGSVYALTCICQPRLQRLFYDKTKMPHQFSSSIEDFYSAVVVWMNELMEVVRNEKGKEHGFDASKNDSILPYAESNFESCINKLLKDDMSPHLRNKYGWSYHYLEELTERENNPEQVPDLTGLVEDYVLARMEKESSGKIVDDVVASSQTTSEKIHVLTTLKKSVLSEEEEKAIFMSEEEDAEEVSEKEAV